MARCDSEPFPIEAKLYLPGFVFRTAISCATELTPSSRFHREHARLRDQLSHGRDVLARIVWQRTANTDAKRRSIRRGFRHGIGAEIAACARLVLDQECAPRVFLLQPLDDQARHDIRCRSRSKWHHNAYGFGGPILGCDCRAEAKGQEERRDQTLCQLIQCDFGHQKCPMRGGGLHWLQLSSTCGGKKS